MGVGSTRLALRIPQRGGGPGRPSFVLKLATNSRGLGDNQTEAGLWRWAVDNAATDPRAALLRDRLLPVWMAADDHSWLIFPEAMAYRRSARVDEVEVLLELEEVGLLDLQAKNLALTEDGVKVLDYGTVREKLRRLVAGGGR